MNKHHNVKTAQAIQGLEDSKGHRASNKASMAITKAMIQNALDELPKIIEIAQFQAKIQKINYDSFIVEGFTEKQAIELCKK